MVGSFIGSFRVIGKKSGRRQKKFTTGNRGGSTHPMVKADSDKTKEKSIALDKSR
jgi:hypothetical protein